MYGRINHPPVPNGRNGEIGWRRANPPSDTFMKKTKGDPLSQELRRALVIARRAYVQGAECGDMMNIKDIMKALSPDKSSIIEQMIQETTDKGFDTSSLPEDIAQLYQSASRLYRQVRDQEGEQLRRRRRNWYRPRSGRRWL